MHGWGRRNVQRSPCRVPSSRAGVELCRLLQPQESWLCEPYVGLAEMLALVVLSVSLAPFASRQAPKPSRRGCPQAGIAAHGVAGAVAYTCVSTAWYSAGVALALRGLPPPAARPELASKPPGGLLRFPRARRERLRPRLCCEPAVDPVAGCCGRGVGAVRVPLPLAHSTAPRRLVAPARRSTGSRGSGGPLHRSHGGADRAGGGAAAVAAGLGATATGGRRSSTVGAAETRGPPRHSRDKVSLLQPVPEAGQDSP